MRIQRGRPYPLGATWDGLGVNLALFSERATRVELCLFADPDATAESVRLELPEQTDQIWHGYMRGILPGQLYGYRVHGPYDPAAGLRFNPNKVVLDPYAKAIGRTTRWDDTMYGYRIGDPEADLSFDDRDNAASCCLGAVIDPASPGATISGRPRPGTRPSSTSCTYPASPGGTPKCRRHSAAPMPGSPARR